MVSKLITNVVGRRIIGILLEKNASLSEISRESHTTKANVFHTLQELEKEDIVRKSVEGRTHLYRFNFLQPEAKRIMGLFLAETKKAYLQKMKGLPLLLHFLLENMLIDKYHGCIFFGSSVKERYNDIDVFVIAEGVKQGSLQKEVKKVNDKISLIVGTLHELEKGINDEDQLYKNIIKGMPFGCESLVLELRQHKSFLRREDIVERFTLGYREILSCLEFTEKEYVKTHIEKGIMDITYSTLNYLDIFPENDVEARKIFKRQIGFVFSQNTSNAKEQAEKIAEMIL